jgi:protein gp37
MAANSAIEWTESTWNPVTGCTKISSGCAHCYAERMAVRLQAIGHPNYVNGFEVTAHEQMLDLPIKWRKPQMVFVNSMGDLFHEKVPESFILSVFNTMRMAPWHCFQLLTKRSERLALMDTLLDWPKNVWMGVTVESTDYTNRIDDLRETGATVKFLSLEPLLGPIPGLDLHGIDWAIVGGESGPGARPMEAHWVTNIRNQCHDSGVSFFFKQWGGVHKKKNGRVLEGRTWDEIPLITTEQTSPALV